MVALIILRSHIMKQYSEVVWKFSFLSLFVLLMLLGVMNTRSHAGTPKYIFYFIGDGMASVQIHAAEAYFGRPPRKG